MLPIIDTHHHLWDLKRFRLPWLDTVEALNRSFLMADYLKATEDLNIVKTVYMEVDVEPSQQADEAKHIMAMCRRTDNPMAVAVISGQPQSSDFPSYLNQFCNNPWIKGVRHVLHTQPPGICLQPDFVRGVHHLGERGLSFDLCCRPGDLPDGIQLIDQCPHTRFILDHCGNVNIAALRRSLTNPPLQEQSQQWKQDISALGERKNVICKISGIVAGAGDGWTADDLAPVINHCLDAFGPDRVIFGGDWPVCTIAASYRQWLDALKQIIASRKEEDQRKLLHDNAMRFYGLE